MDNVGKIDANNKRYFYIKDHLGSIRIVMDTTNSIVFANDYDIWGHPLENRFYERESQRYKFTGKERDNELQSSYDYFGARYYDSRIGRWGGVEPLLNKYPGFSPYSYSANNPIIFKDYNGEEIDLSNIQNHAFDLKSNLEYVTGLTLDIQENKIINLQRFYIYNDFTLIMD